MILVDSSVWIDYFRGDSSAEVAQLHELVETKVLAIPDLVVVEVLQGFRSDVEFESANARLSSLIVLSVGGLSVAVEAARNFRKLRTFGVTIRKTIDSVIATYCILNDHELLFSDRDFDPFVKHLGLRSAMQARRRFSGP